MSEPPPMEARKAAADDKAKVDAIVGIYNTTKNGGKK